MERLPDLDTEQKAVRARKRIEQIKGFYQHLLAYCLFTPFTIFINYKTYWDYKWFWFPMFGWGIGLAIHGFVVFIQKGMFESKWEKRKIEELMRKDENNWE